MPTSQVLADRIKGQAAMEQWLEHDNLWVRRASILHQLRSIAQIFLAQYHAILQPFALVDQRHNRFTFHIIAYVMI